MVRDLIVDRGGRRAVDRVSFVMEGPGWTGLVGANGSGKTSLLRALAGRIEAQGGTILVDGIDRTPDRSWRAQAIGFAPEASTMPETLSGRELFAILGGDTPGRDPEDPLAPLRRALDFDSFLDRRIGTLSAGMRQRLAIFCAFLTRPRAAILDEPFNWLDPVCAFDTREALGALVAVEGLTLITALHETTTLVRHCQSGLLLSDGQVSRSLGPADMTAGARDHAAFEAEMIAGLRGEPGRGLS
ncbi:MAG TPA: ABC transporter ATP-binding protein [Allosphingosinicella sp.]|nr:ABC transporter ATP-binding protein [Allosphingosinicella sp.]